VAVSLSPFAGAGAQFFDNNGTILSGGKIFTYAAGTTTPLQTYTTISGSTPHANPIILDSAGRVPSGQIWLLSNTSYKFVLETADGILIATYDNILVDMDSAGVSFIQSGAGAVIGNVQDELRALFIRPEQFSSLAFADAAAVADNRPLLLTENYTISSSQTLNADLYFNGGQFSVAPGQTLTLRGQVVNKDTLSQLFFGAGSAVGLKFARPEWWGAARDGLTNDTPALTAAHTCVQASSASRGDRPTIQLAAGVYGIGATWKVEPTLSCPLKIDGASWAIGGTRLQVLPSFSTAGGTMAFHIDGQLNTTEAIAAFEIGGFGIFPDASACTIGYQIGSDGKWLLGVQQNLIHDIHMGDGFDTQTFLVNCRLIDFDRCSWWNRTKVGTFCIDFGSAATGLGFCGDMNFNSCQMVGGINNGFANTLLRCSPNVTGYQVKGVRFNDTIFYKSENNVVLSPSNGGIVGDWWFNPGCQFDGFSKSLIYGRPTGAGTILDNINILGVYMRGILAGFFAVDLGALSSARLEAITVGKCWFANIQDGSGGVKIEAATNIHVDENSFTECGSTTGRMILLNAVRSFTCNGNTLSQVTPILVLNFITLGAGTNYGATVHNSGNGSAVTTVQNLSGLAELTITPNW
jgi:hypothetical protein